VDSRVVTDGGPARRVTQPVEFPAGWQPPTAPLWLAEVQRSRGPVGAVFDARDLSDVMQGPRPAHRMASPAATAGGASPDRLRAIIEMEARRLRAAETMPAHTHRQLLADLAPRLHGLLADSTDPATEPLRALLARLTSAALEGDGMDDLWRATRKTLEDFLRNTADSRSRITFWKR
jgi:Ca-activated chloride channel family protein